MRKVYDDGALKEHQCQYWFARFCSSNYSVKNIFRSGQPSEIDDEKIKALIEANRRYIIRELIAEALKISIGNIHLYFFF